MIAVKGKQLYGWWRVGLGMMGLRVKGFWDAWVHMLVDAFKVSTCADEALLLGIGAIEHVQDPIIKINSSCAKDA